MKNILSVNTGDRLHHEELVQWDGRLAVIVMRLASDGDYRRVLGCHGDHESDAAGALVRMLATAYGERGRRGVTG